MQNLAATRTPVEASPLSIRYFSARLVLPFFFFGALWFILCRQLSGEWSVNEQYNYGWFVPFFAVYLFWLRWQDRPAPQVRSQRSAVSDQKFAPANPSFGGSEVRHGESVLRRIGGQWSVVSGLALAVGLTALLLLLLVRLFEIANPEWRPLGWIHAASVAALTLLYLWCVGGRPWLRHFAFPVAFIFVAVPWVTPVEVPIIQGLMRAVAGVAAETVTLFGIPAQLEGNLIRVTNGLVGVNEACSGVRSLQTALMIGLLFGELKRLSIWRRVALLASAIALALVANLCRAVFLVWIAATKSISEVNRWHELAGYAIVGLVFVGTVILATLLGRNKAQGKVRMGDGNTEHPTLNIEHRIPFRLPASWLAFALCWIVAVELGAHFWYSAHESNLVSGIPWSVQWPEQAPNFRKLKIDEEIRSVLRFDEGQAAAWTIGQVGSALRADRTPRSGVPTDTISCLLYVFRWKAGRNSALLANLHRPDVCLPASGWTQVADDGVRNYQINGSFELPFRHFEFQRAFEGLPPQTAHAFYCLSEDRAARASARSQSAKSPGMSGSRSEWTRAERVRAVLEGRRHLGQQVIEAIFIRSEPLSSADAESHLRDLVRDVVSINPGGE